MSVGNFVLPALPDYGVLAGREVLWDKIDTVAPAASDPALAAYGGKIPLTTQGLWVDLAPGNLFLTQLALTSAISLDQYTAHAGVLIPRAVSYGAGLIDYFFRGQLNIEPITQGVFAVISQGVAHTVDAEGYPRDDNGDIFGFKKLRVKVGNGTAPIIESGTGSNFPQTVGAGTLVAVARYHRNPCYQPNLDGQRVQHYAPAPALWIDEPVCADGQRTPYQEISVSAEMAIGGPADLPGGDGSTSTVEKMFDFSADPIPVNATDLFLQIVYRGVLGDEPDAIATGTFDVREPAFVATYNGSDYRWNGAAWLPGVIGSSTRGADFLHICAGSPSKLIYRMAVPGQHALTFPVTSAPPLPSGVVRLGVLFATPSTPNGNRVVRHQPTMIPSPSPEPRITTTKGPQRQGSKETIAAEVLNAPVYCGISAPVGDTWCNDPIQQRRGQKFGDMAQAIYYTPVAGNDVNIDVDAVPLPLFSGVNLQTDGEIRFDDEPLTDCPIPAAITVTKSQLLQEVIELQEAAAAQGITIKL